MRFFLRFRSSVLLTLIGCSLAVAPGLLVACSSPAPAESPNPPSKTNGGADGGVSGNKPSGGGNKPTGDGKDAGAPTAAGSGSGSVTGKPDGKEVSVKNAYAEIFDTPGADAPIRALLIGLSDSTSGACGSELKGDARGLDLQLTFSHDAKLPEPKTYSFTSSGQDNSIQFFASAGGDGSGKIASAGSITITQVDDAHVKGTFTATIDGNKIDGAFDAPMCPAGSDAPQDGDANEDSSSSG